MCRSNGRDTISRLPDNVIEHILSFLPLREAVKTSLLSREWRNKWAYLPTLVFDDNFTTTLRMRRSPYEVLFNVLYVLKLHSGPVREFALSFSDREICLPRQLDQILHSLDTTHVESLSINVQNYFLPRCLSSFEKLRKLHLCSCICTSSVIAFDRFPLLTVLELRKVMLFENVQVSFVFNCPLLSDLTMIGCGGWRNKISIVIVAPSLERFHFAGSFTLLDFKHTPLLKRVYVHQEFSIFQAADEETYNIYKIMNGLPAVEHLSVSGFFLNYLVIGAKYGAIAKPWTPTHLIVNELGSNDYDQLLSAILMLDIIFPYLKEVVINYDVRQVSVSRNTMEGLVRVLLQRKVVHRHLKLVKVNKLRGTVLETLLIRRLLDSSSALEQMEIGFPADLPDDHRMSIQKQLIQLPRASPTARIIFN